MFQASGDTVKVVRPTVSGTTLNAAVTLPANKPAAFMKVAK